MRYEPLSVEFMFSPGCCCAAPALRLLRRVLTEEHCNAPVTVRVVASREDAIRRRFSGSPTILIDGVDIEGPSTQGRGYDLGCRTYEPHGECPGVPDADLIRRAIQLHPGKRHPGPSVGNIHELR